MHLKSDTFANRLRDLTKILEVNRLAIEDKNTSIFLVGALNFKNQNSSDIKLETSQASASSAAA